MRHRADREDRIYELQQALAGLTPADWPGYLASHCDGDDTLRDEVLRRQRAMEDSRLLLRPATPLQITSERQSSPPEAADDDAGLTAAHDDAAGRMVGDYRLLHRLGEGGMGIVYEAEQQNPRRVVAVKVVRGGTAVGEISVKLFQREAQALGRLKHPGIAAIYEAGKAASGEHFFAMELVRGVHLIDYARSMQGSTASVLRRRLEVFALVCRAVAYAHQRGVIHRDLKPSNVLVIPHEDTETPEIKILDFGLARITDPEVSVAPHSHAGSVAGTLAYMSPEQAQGRSDDIDVRSDVYSLGVILYELLTGRVPVEVHAVPLFEAIRRIAEEPPLRPASIWTEPTARSSGRKHRLDNDLVTITMKALEKPPSRRYQSAAALAEDVERYLRNEPVLARPATAAYQLHKLVSRHKVGAGFAAVVALLLVVFAAAMATQTARTARERDRALIAEQRALAEAETAKRVSDFLVETFSTSDPFEKNGSSITARDILDRGAARVEQELKGQPTIQATLMDTIARAYDGLGLFDSARPLLEQALSVRRNHLTKEHAEVAASLANLGSLLREMGDYAAAERHIQESLEMRRKVLGGNHPDVAASLSQLGLLKRLQGNYRDAEQLHRDALAIRRQQLGNDHLDVAESLNNLASALMMQESYDAAEPMFREALDIRRRLLGAEHPFVASNLGNLGSVYFRQGDYSRALPLYQQTLDMNRRIFGPSHPRVSISINNLALALRDMGNYAEAEPLFRTVVDMDARLLGPHHPEVANRINNLGSLLVLAGKPSAAEPLHREALVIQQRALGKDHWQVALTKTLLGICLTANRRFAAAESMLLDGYPMLKEKLGVNHRHTSVALQELITLYDRWGKPKEAAEYRALLPPTRPLN